MIMPRKLWLMADWGTWPLWEPGTDHYAVDPEVLPISSELKASLKTWADAWDATLNQEYPPNSGFPSPAEEARFDDEGSRLRGELQRELGPDFVVKYRSHLRNYVEEP